MALQQFDYQHRVHGRFDRHATGFPLALPGMAVPHAP